MTDTEKTLPKQGRLRLWLLLAGLIVVFLIARQSTWLSQLDPHSVRETVQQWGSLGILLYGLLFCVGLLLYVPGTVFIVAAGLLYGPFWGTLIAFCVANIAVLMSFNLVRRLGGKTSSQSAHPWLSAKLGNLSRQPVKTVVMLRTFLWTAPVLNYVLALSSIEQRHHIVGTLLGTIAPIIFIVAVSDWILLNLFN